MQRAGHPNSIYYFVSHWTGVAEGGTSLHYILLWVTLDTCYRTPLLCHATLFWTGVVDDRTSLLCHATLFWTGVVEDRTLYAATHTVLDRCCK